MENDETAISTEEIAAVWPRLRTEVKQEVTIAILNHRNFMQGVEIRKMQGFLDELRTAPNPANMNEVLEAHNMEAPVEGS